MENHCELQAGFTYSRGYIEIDEGDFEIDNTGISKGNFSIIFEFLVITNFTDMFRQRRLARPILTPFLNGLFRILVQYDSSRFASFMRIMQIFTRQKRFW